MEKKLSAKQQLEKQYNQQLARINRWLRAREKEDVFLRPGALPERPKRITEASVRRLKALTADELWKRAVKVDTETGEITPVKGSQALDLPEPKKGRTKKLEDHYNSPSMRTPHERKGHPMSEETRKKISESLKAYWEKRKASGEPIKGHPMSEEQRKKQSERMKKYWEERRPQHKFNPDEPVKPKERKKRKPMSEEQRKKLSERMKKYWYEKKEEQRRKIEEENARKEYYRKSDRKQSEEAMSKEDTSQSIIERLQDLIDRADTPYRQKKAAHAERKLYGAIDRDGGKDKFINRITLLAEDLYDATDAYIYSSSSESEDQGKAEMEFILDAYGYSEHLTNLNTNEVLSIDKEWLDAEEGSTPFDGG